MEKFREVGGAKDYRAWDLWDNGDYVLGEYVGTGESETVYGIQQYHDVRVKDASFEIGKVIRLNGNGSLDSKMEELEEGQTVKVEYFGKKVLTSGKYKGKDFHDVRVSVAEKQVAQEAEFTGL